jgi:hypothetical protein
MGISTERPEPVEILIAPAFIRQAIALVFGVAPFAALAIWTPFAVGPSRFFQSFSESSVGWWMYLMFLAPIVLFLRLAFPPKSAMARLQIRRDGISFIPGRWVKQYFAQSVVDAPITHQSSEILLCQKGLPDIFAVLVRSSDRRDREVYAGASLTLRSREQAQKISAAISTVTGLPVSLITLRKRADGFIEEKPWTPGVRSSELRLLTLIMSGLLPLLGGVVAGHLVPQTLWIAVIGIGLWFARVIVIARFSPDITKRSPSAIAVSAAHFFLFEVWYAMAVIIVIYIFPHV